MAKAWRTCRTTARSRIIRANPVCDVLFGLDVFVCLMVLHITPGRRSGDIVPRSRIQGSQSGLVATCPCTTQTLNMPPSQIAKSLKRISNRGSPLSLLLKVRNPPYVRRTAITQGPMTFEVLWTTTSRGSRPCSRPCCSPPSTSHSRRFRAG